jgi:hypothetical protein
LLLSVVIEQLSANTPSGPAAMLPPPVTRIAPPLLTTGPVTPVEIVRVDGMQPAQAAPGVPSVASAMSEAEASNAGRKRPTLAGVTGLAGWGPFCEPFWLQRCFALMTSAPMINCCFRLQQQ